MKIEEVIKQLERLIDDREAFIRAYAPDRNVFVRDKEALEEAVKMLKRYNRLMQVKARPVKQHIKIQYEGEELTIKELVDRLHKYKFLFRFWKEEAEKAMKVADELRKMYADVQPVRHGRWITVVGADGKEYSKCSDCQTELDGLEDAYSFCPHCGAKMDGEKKMEYENPCKNCKWHDVFWKGAGCNLLNNMEPCRFDAKDTNVPTKSEMEEEDNG